MSDHGNDSGSESISSEGDENEGSKVVEDGKETIENIDAVKLSWFQSTFPCKKHKKGLPLASKKTHMIDRRPVWLPKYGLDMTYFKHASYFSEIISREQLSRQMLFDALYKPKYGDYQFCKTVVVKKQFLSNYLCGVHSCKFSPFGKYLVSGFGNGSVEVFNLKNKKRQIIEIKGMARKITSIRFRKRHPHKCYASSSTGRVYEIQKSTDGWKAYSFLKEFNNEINGMDMCPRGHFIATAGKDACIRIYDIKNKKLVQAFPRSGIDVLATVNEENKEPVEEMSEEGHSKRICALRYDPSNENVFATGGWDNIVKLWDSRSGRKPVRCLYGPHICGDAIDIIDKYILTGQWTSNDSLQLWDMTSSKLIRNVSPLNRPICYSGEFINSTRFLRNWEHKPIIFPSMRGDLILAAGSGTKALEIISIKENMVLHAAEEANAVVALDYLNDVISYGAVNNIYSIICFQPFVGPLSLLEKEDVEAGKSGVTADKEAKTDKEKAANEGPIADKAKAGDKETTTNKEETKNKKLTADKEKIINNKAGQTESGFLVGISKNHLRRMEALKKRMDEDRKRPHTPKEDFIKDFIQEVRKTQDSGPKSVLREKLENYISSISGEAGISRLKKSQEDTSLAERMVSFNN